MTRSDKDFSLAHPIARRDFHSFSSWPSVRCRYGLSGPSILAAGIVFLMAGAIGATAAEIKNGPAAIKKAQHICRLTAPRSPGQWQAVSVKNTEFGDEWHVWFGKDAMEPTCGFYGAVVKSDGSSTSCVVTACQLPNPLHAP